MSIQAIPALEPIVTTSILVLSDVAAPSAPVQQEKVMEKRKKKAVGKKVRRKIKSSEGEDLSQEQGSLDYREIVQVLMERSILPHIVERMRQKDDIQRFDESFTAFLEKELREEREEMAKLRAELALEKEEKEGTG
ncbi:hypothetical protein COCNU_scaffold000110G000110 [Cocos nucifera]|nr:hypothetical protein [Cocos nucifera]